MVCTNHEISCSVLPASVTPPLVGPGIILSIPFLTMLSLCSTTAVSDQGMYHFMLWILHDVLSKTIQAMWKEMAETEGFCITHLLPYSSMLCI